MISVRRLFLECKHFECKQKNRRHKEYIDGFMILYINHLYLKFV